MVIKAGKAAPSSDYEKVDLADLEETYIVFLSTAEGVWQDKPYVDGILASTTADSAYTVLSERHRLFAKVLVDEAQRAGLGQALVGKLVKKQFKSGRSGWVLDAPSDAAVSAAEKLEKAHSIKVVDEAF